MKVQLFKSRRGKVQKEPAKRNFVLLSQLDFRELDPVKIPLPSTFAQLLQDATTSLRLKRPARQLYDETGIPFEDISSINPGSTLYVSVVEPHVPKPDDAVPKLFEQKPRQDWPTWDLPNVKAPKPPERPEDADIHLRLAKQTQPIKTVMNDALLALFASLPQSHKDQLPSSGVFQKAFLETQYSFVVHSLLSQFIGPTSSMSHATVYHDTVEWMIGRFVDATLSDARFVITGPTQSGKSTLLEIAVRLFLQKLQLCGDSGGYLFVIVNWKLHEDLVDDLFQLYLVVVKATLNGLRCSKMEMIPVLDDVLRWFASLLGSRAFPPMPVRLRDFRGFPAGRSRRSGSEFIAHGTAAAILPTF
jgi:hypothetical protein